MNIKHKMHSQQVYDCNDEGLAQEQQQCLDWCKLGGFAWRDDWGELGHWRG